MNAADGVTLTDADLDIVGRSAYPGGPDRELPLIEIVWSVSRELVIHSGEAWLTHDPYAARHQRNAAG